MKKRARDTKRADQKALITRLRLALSRIHVATDGKKPVRRKAVETVAGLAR